MHGLSAEEVLALLEPRGFRVERNGGGWSTPLRLEASLAAAQARVGAAPPDGLRLLRELLEAAAGWLPGSGARVLWIDRFEHDLPGGDAMLLALRRGLGEARDLDAAPGWLFAPQAWAERDQSLIPAEQGAALSVLVGMATALLVSGGYGWLVGEGGPERIEFWEGNVFFHSADRERLEQAKALLAGCGPVR